MEDVGEMILDRPFQVPIADLAAELDGGRSMSQRFVDIAGGRLGERQAGQGRDPCRRIVRVRVRHGSL